MPTYTPRYREENILICKKINFTSETLGKVLGFGNDQWFIHSFKIPNHLGLLDSIFFDNHFNIYQLKQFGFDTSIKYYNEKGEYTKIIVNEEKVYTYPKRASKYKLSDDLIDMIKCVWNEASFNAFIPSVFNNLIKDR